jgi:hypothetical protein
METGFHAKTANIFTQPPTGAATVQAYDDGKIELQSPDGKAKLKSWTSATLKPYTAETIGAFLGWLKPNGQAPEKIYAAICYKQNFPKRVKKPS